MKPWRTATLAIVLCIASPAVAETLQQRVEIELDRLGPGPRFGLVVADDQGREIVTIAPDDRFVPASNTKMFTTAAAFATLDGLDSPDATGGAFVRLDKSGKGPPDVMLVGQGDGRLSSAANCLANCLATLADAVAAKTRVVGAVIGDDSLFPDQRWSPGMSWNNIPTRSGTATSALTLDDNELAMTVSASALGKPPLVALSRYYTVDNRAVTVASGKTELAMDRAPNERVVRLWGTIAVGAEPELIGLGIDDPAHHAAWVFKALLEARGVKVSGPVTAQHRPPTPADYPETGKTAPPVRAPRQQALASLVPPPIADDIVRINKASQNLHAELLLRRIGLRNGNGSIADGLVAVRAMLDRAGIARTAYDLSDGSGMSSYNRVSPRGMVGLLGWIAAQPWGAAWRNSLPVGGVDGTLAKRFSGTTLERRVFAKTGTLNATNALSGYLTAKSGRTLTFSFYVNDIPDGVSATATMENVLELIAREN